MNHPNPTTPTASHKWEKPPGKLDALHTGDLFASDNPWGFPTIGNAGHIVPAQLWPYNIRTKSAAIQQAAAVHFYLDDYQFENAWTRPRRALSYVGRFCYGITPDYSIWSHWPATLQLFNTYRSRWVGAVWLQHGQTVIPSVSWAGPDSFQFAFDGIKRGSTVAISTMGIRGPDATKAHITGLDAMLATVQPSNILCYGRMLHDPGVPFVEYPTFWDMKKAGQLAPTPQPTQLTEKTP